MVTLLVAKGDSPTVPDWITAWGTPAAAAIALVAMGFSINAAVKSRRDAGQATDAFKKIAKSHAEMSNTGQMQFQLATQQADDALKDEARNVAVVKGVFKGRGGIAVRNGNQTSTIRHLQVDFRSGPQDTQFDPVVVVHSSKGTNTEQAPWELAALEPTQTTADSWILQKQNGPANLGALIDLTRIRFKDSRNTWWQAIGNGDPVKIEIVPVTP